MLKSYRPGSGDFKNQIKNYDGDAGCSLEDEL